MQPVASISDFSAVCEIGGIWKGAFLFCFVFLIFSSARLSHVYDAMVVSSWQAGSRTKTIVAEHETQSLILLQVRLKWGTS